MRKRISDTVLTAKRGPDRIRIGMNPLAVIIQHALGDRSVQTGADMCGVSHHVLRDIIGGNSMRPRPDNLKAIAEGLGIPYQQLVMAAYQPTATT